MAPLHVMALSGGKDSTALALRMAELGMPIDHYVITPTGDEPAAMIAHWRKVAELLGKPLTVASQGKSLAGEIKRQAMLPNHRARWCTRILKLDPYYTWMRAHSPCISYVGLRADEGDRVGMIFPEEAGVQVRFPMKEWGWTIQDVYAYLDQRGVTIPDRTDCNNCFWARLGELYVLWRDDRQSFDLGADLEDFVSEARGKPYTFRSPQRDAWPAGRRALGAEFARGRVPTRSLARMEKDKRREVGSCRACTL
ncbi:phosphoadenosine phosphosulfate reductase family protein [Methylobacterium sp. Leaf106]|uniref:phosphoadenosine phosphosulfate reductase family protein n=1 Tax=Methylobacterium sp. Leaf106 TaxID=1736255 RepID=UPI0006F88F2C|nr:phosphoadenosine phosphosulfate reductase family protein [Methylobacterium sp. Leaf106]KQP52965.1 hypothetical protein ASF34_00920 [Methylobacterium sp. Leaf106]